MADYESKKKRMQSDLDRGNEFRQAIREPGAPRDMKLNEMVKSRITLPKVAIQGCPHCGYRHPPDGVCV